jgi:DNA-binding MarR family transcriptional regulator
MSKIPRLQDTVTYRMHELKKLTDRQTEAQHLAQLGISLPDARCVSVAGSYGAMSISELASRSHLTRGQASRAAEQLIRRGLLAKSNHEQDGRSVVVQLTSSGRYLHKKIMLLVQQRNDSICRCLSIDERQTLHHLMNKLLIQARQDARASLKVRELHESLYE